MRGDSVMYPDGTPVRGPKALRELLGYYWIRLVEFWHRHDGKRDELARSLTIFCRFRGKLT
jgi:hypothetical protein